MRSIEFRSNPMFLRNQFNDTAQKYHIPTIKRQSVDFSSLKLIGYDKTKMNDTENSQRFVHFFLDDYKFEVMWNNPEPRIDKLRQYRGVLSPQFSTYYTMPLALQLYNTFRSRWCGAYFQQHGLTVIPTVSWGLPDSYDFCFEGIERGSIVAVSTVGVRDEKQYFFSGYNEMMRRISPSVIICYGSPFPEMQGYIIPVNYVETNNLTPQEKLCQSKDDLSAYKFFCPPVPDPLSQYIIAAGMGGGGSNVVELHIGRQGKHMPDHNNYQPGRSIIYGDATKIQQLLNKFAGKGQKIGINKELVDFEEPIGIYINNSTSYSGETSRGIIHYSNQGAHLVPAKPQGGY